MTRREAKEPPLPPGTRVGRYRIESVLGRGGMAIVYRARDTELGRDVALKTPSPSLGDDVTQRRRFLREARAGSRISSPHVVPVFDIFEVDSTPWLAMALVDGQTLRDYLAERGRPPLDVLLRFAEEIAQGLQTAHAHHILHRDLKPANVLIGADGRALITDFGLARPYLTPDEIQAASTDSDPITQGELVGTVAYMSPEQALGRPLDPRSDIFALGTLLYEMCTGRPAFEATPRAGVRDALLHREPAPIASYNQEVPDELIRIIRKAMAKDPEERYPDVRDLLVDLRALRQRHERDRYDAKHPDATPARAAARRRLPGRLVLLSLLAVLSLLLLWRSRADRRLESPIVSRTPRVSAVTTWPTIEAEGRLSPDLEWVSFLSDRSGSSNLWLRKLTGGEPTQLTSEVEPILSHVWSPDGNEIAYALRRAGQTVLRIIPAPLGGPLRLEMQTDADLGPALRLVAWVERSIYLEGIGGLYRADRERQSIVPALPASEDPAGLRRHFDLDPSGDRLAFVTMEEGRDHLWVADRDGRSARVASADEFFVFSPQWAGERPDRLVFVSNRTGQRGLWSLDVGGAEFRELPFAGEPFSVDDVSSDGNTLTISTASETASLWQLDPATGSETPLTADRSSDLDASFSGDSLVAFQRSRSNVESGVGLFDARVVLARVRGDELLDERILVEEGYAPSLSPDGRWVAFLRTDPSTDFRTELWLLERTTLQRRCLTERVQFNGFYFHPPELVSREAVWERGGGLLFVSIGARGEREVRRFRPAGDATATLLFVACEEDRWLAHPLVSPDGNELAYVLRGVGSDSIQTCEVVLADLRSGERRTLVSATRPRQTQERLLGWRPDGSELIAAVLSPNSDLTQAVEFAAIDRRGRRRTLGILERAHGQTARWFGAGDEIYIVRSRDGRDELGAYSFGDRTWRVLIENRLPNVTFAGIALRPSGGLVYSRQVTSRDVWVLRQ